MDSMIKFPKYHKNDVLICKRKVRGVSNTKVRIISYRKTNSDIIAYNVYNITLSLYDVVLEDFLKIDISENRNSKILKILN